MINYVLTIGFIAVNFSKPITSVVNRDDDVTVTTERLNRSRKHSCVTLMTPLQVIRLRFGFYLILKFIYLALQRPKVRYYWKPCSIPCEMSCSYLTSTAAPDKQ
jgi:hypothetical protein